MYGASVKCMEPSVKCIRFTFDQATEPKDSISVGAMVLDQLFAIASET
jgi:hypothetical protein